MNMYLPKCQQHRIQYTTLLSAKMALLCSSTDIPHVGTQKDKFGLKWPKQFRWAWPSMHYPQTKLIYFYYGFWVAYATMCIENCVSYTSICIATSVYLHTRVPFEQLVCHTRVAYINTRIYLNSTLKNMNQDYMRLVGP